MVIVVMKGVADGKGYQRDIQIICSTSYFFYDLGDGINYFFAKDRRDILFIQR